VDTIKETVELRGNFDAVNACLGFISIAPEVLLLLGHDRYTYTPAHTHTHAHCCY